MSNVKTQKRIAAEVLGISEDRVWLNPEALSDISQAMTRDDVRELIKQGLVQEKPEKKQARIRAKKRRILRKKRKSIGHGKRSGSKNSRKSSKERWMERARSQRKYLRDLKEKGSITSSVYRKYYLRVKGGHYKTLRQLKESMRTEGAMSKKN